SDVVLLHSRRRPPSSPPFPYTTLFRSRKPPDWCAHKCAYTPFSAINSLCVPCSIISPLSNTIKRSSAAMVDRRCAIAITVFPCRSEEHTSELQSRENLVCRLLLEKKKK